ncbi:hypothetical protein Pfo_014203 [Paulownia fortunei]|nr:hypothetical protein Pfo_014203 [Paulownia fortunei]
MQSMTTHVAYESSYRKLRSLSINKAIKSPMSTTTNRCYTSISSNLLSNKPSSSGDIAMAPVPNFVNFPFFPPTPPHYIPAPPNVPPPHNPPSPPKVTPPRPPITAPPPPKFPIPGPPPPHHAPSPPPPPAVKPPNLPVTPPPPSVKPPPHPISPPPPPHPVSPPPPHIVPSPPHPISPPPPPSPPGHHSTVIIFVFVSIGGLFFLAFLAAALFCCVKKRKKRIVQETDKFKIDEHVKVQEAIVPGPHGTQTVVLTIDEDVHVEEEIKKTEVEGKSSHLRSGKINSQALEVAGFTSESNHHRDCKE